MDGIAQTFLDKSRHLIVSDYVPKIERCLDDLAETDIWWRPNEASNSIGNLLLHLQGNVTQWLVASFNRWDDKRNRPAEFSARSGLAASVLLERLETTMDEAARVLDRLTVEELLAPYEIQGYHVRGMDAVYQVVEHFGLHYGQIVYVAKLIGAKDLGFYSELNQTGRAK